MTHEAIREHLALFAMGGLESDESEAIAQHLVSCLQCQRLLGQYQETLGDLDLAMTEPDWAGHQEMRQMFQSRLPNVTPPVDTPNASIRTIRRSRGRWGWPAAWAATLLVAFSGWSVAYRAHQEVTQSQRIMAFMTTGRPVSLVSVHAAHAQVDLYLNSSHAVVWVKNLAPLSENQVYEGWWIIKGRPEPAGTFGRGATLLTLPKNATAFAITKEPRGGTKQPTGPILVLGTL